ncbi:wall-associated receptor kinase-like 8 [Juglans microcarpa x Juglans regia]|uniref:wall-associated receptor kinase-like 8 n=1 Tax=Juglans microcarpa x Juglans regia TaxID=2249226 RepID=UPI001B7E608D|nr:wall-associated receptor kinase-like 8 [Juglans microcarpa x Juglans regia]
MVVRLVLIQSIFFLSSFNSFAQPASTLFTKDGCQEFCGSVRIPYPFGIGADYCYLDPWFEIVCETESFGSTTTHKPLLKSIKGRLEVLGISSRASTLTVNYNVSASCSTNGPTAKNNMEFEKSPFAFSENNNIFIAMGCNNSASMWSLDERISFGGCKSPCEKAEFINGSRGCDGRSNCCQTEIPYDLNSFITTIEPKNNSSINGSSSECNYAFLVEKNWFEKNFTILYPKLSVPVVLKWGIDRNKFPSKLFHGRKQYRCDLHYPTMLGNHNFTISTYTCACAPGYNGNPYLPQLHGCQDIDECENPELNRCTDSRCKNTDGGYHCTDTINSIIIGISTSLGALFLICGGWWSYKVIKKRKRMKQREKLFQRNGGLLLQQQLSMTEANVENTKLFNQKELEMATNYFHVNRILGQGGQGTVYKGMLADGRIVAIKKSKVMDEGKLKEFINEVVILSGINHRNVVKLLGCCLETEVPLLVYEYVPNGTLFQYLSDQNEEFPLTWDMRLRIATEVAGALFYLHSVASSPIYHRDIKSLNILLDGKHIAKVADFGISRSIAIDQTHLSTLVHGTFGYIDPEYFRSGQFTEKSDVYSFGVVLAELLTGEKAVSSTRSPATKSLASYIISSMEENILFDILDNQVLKEAKKPEIVLVADLVKRCVYWNGRNRPTMKEVTMELEAIQMSRNASNLEQDYNEEIEFVRSEVYIQSCDTSKSKMTCTDSTGVTSFMDSHPFLSS